MAYLQLILFVSLFRTYLRLFSSIPTPTLGWRDHSDTALFAYTQVQCHRARDALTFILIRIEVLQHLKDPIIGRYGRKYKDFVGPERSAYPPLQSGSGWGTTSAFLDN